jgi:hypothetical protein
MFQPLVPSSSSKQVTASAVKSVIELMIIASKTDGKLPQSQSVQQLLSKVVEDSCKWVGIIIIP